MKRVVKACVVSTLCLWYTTAPADERAARDSNEDFVGRAATSGTTEVDLGKLATQRGKRAEVKAYGERIVLDHAAANKELLGLAARKRIPVPSVVNADQQHAITKLSNLSGAEFDRAFVAQMVKNHQTDIALFRRESERGQDGELKDFATKVLPTLKEHLRLARELAGETQSRAEAASDPTRD